MHSTRPPAPSMPPPGPFSMPPPGFPSMPAFAPAPLPPGEATPRERIDRLKTIARRALAHWISMGAIVAVGCTIALVMAFQQKLIFRSECQVQYRLGKGEHDESGIDRVMHLAPKFRQVLTTRARLESVIKEFDLYPRMVESRGMGEAIDEAREHIEVRGRDSETFFLSFESESRETAQRVTQRLADDMIQEFESQKVLVAKQKAEFVAREQEQAESRMEEAETALSTLAAEHPAMAAAVKGSLPGSADSLMIAQQRGTARTPSAASAFGVNAPGESANPSAPPSVSHLVTQLTTARDEAAARVGRAHQDLDEKRAINTEQHPDVAAARGDLAIAQRALDGATARLDHAQTEAHAGAGDAAAPRRAFRPSARRDRAPAPALTEAAAEESVQNETALRLDFERGLRAVRDAREVYTQRHDSMEKAKLELSAARATANESMSVLDPANLPTKPYKGGRSKVAMGGGLASLIFALAYAVIAVLLDDRVRDASDLRQLGLRAPIGVIPKISSAPRGRRG